MRVPLGALPGLQSFVVHGATDIVWFSGRPAKPLSRPAKQVQQRGTLLFV